LDGPPASNPKLEGLLAENSINLKSVYFDLPNNTTVHVLRGWNEQDHSFNGMLDSVAINPRGEQDQSRIAKLNRLVRDAFGAIDERTFADTLRDQDRDFYIAREGSLQRLQEMQEQFFSKLQDFTVRQTTEYQKRHDELESRYTTKETSLDELYQQRLASVAEREEQLSAKLKQLDDRASTHVRREIRQDVKKLLLARSERFELTQGTRRRRWVVFACYVVFLSLFGAAAGYFLLNDPGQLQPVYVARQIISSIVFAGTAALFLRWMNSWAKQHADEEFRLKRFELDIDRASWVVEMSLEWAHEMKGEIPQFLVERLSRNLFAEDSAADESLTATDSLASHLLKNAAAAKLRVGDAEVTLEQKGLKRLSKTPASPEAS
jgi:hypothetical protein